MAGMGVKITTSPRDLRSIPRKLRSKADKNKKRAMQRVVLQGVSIIEQRTAKGQGFKGGRFRAYKPEYALFRSQAGRGTTPNLEFTGRMLSALTQTATKSKGIVFFAQSAEAKKAAFNNRTRPFMGFSRDERKELSDVYRATLMPKDWNK